MCLHLVLLQGALQVFYKTFYFFKIGQAVIILRPVEFIKINNFLDEIKTKSRIVHFNQVQHFIKLL